MNYFYSLLLLLFLPYSSKGFTVTTLPPLKGYFFLNQTHLRNDGTSGNCLQKLWLKNATNISTCTLFSWNIDYPTTKTLQQWISDQPQEDLIFHSNGTAATNEYIFAQIFVTADNMPKISKSTYRRIGEHHFQWRFDPFYVSDKGKRIIVRYKRKTACPRPHTYVSQTFEQSFFAESCSPLELFFGEISTSLRTLEELQLPIIPPINESGYKPIKKEDIPIFNPKNGYNEPEFSTAMPTGISHSITVSKEMPHSTKVSKNSTAMPEEITYSTAMPTRMPHSTTVSKEMSQSTTVPKKVSHSTKVSKNSTTMPPAISITVPTGMSHPPTIVPTGMPPSYQDQSSVASAGFTPSWLWGVLIICCILLIIIIAFGSILLYLFYKMKPMIIFDKIFHPATVEKSVKSLQSKKDPQIPAATATLADTKGGVENINAYDSLDLKTPKRSSKEAKSGKRKKQKKSKSNPPEPALKQPSKQPQTPKKSRKLNDGSISSKNLSNASKDSIEKAYKGEINVDRSGKDSKDKTLDIYTDENDKSKSNH